MILGVGTDVVEVGRLERAVARHGEGFLCEFLSAAEIERCRRTSRFLPACAALFAAKEAVMKALSTGRAGHVFWKDILVEPFSGAPGVHLRGGARETMQRLGADRVHLSLACDRAHAAAVAILERTTA
jgi:holo-[acyl-carrier protein] synthase